MEITNPGRPMIDPLHFIDEPARSRKEAIASVMRPASICEERGSGNDAAEAGASTNCDVKDCWIRQSNQTLFWRFPITASSSSWHSPATVLPPHSTRHDLH